MIGFNQIARDIASKRFASLAVRRDHATREDVFYMPEFEDPRMELSLLIGELGHHLRSALDWVAWQLALIETATPHSRTQFPIFRILEDREKKTGFLTNGKRQLKSVSKSAIQRIQAIQPFCNPGTVDRDPLWLLQQLNNADKHRAIQLTVMESYTGHLVVQDVAGANLEQVIYSERQLIRPGAEIARIRLSDVRVKGEVQLRWNMSSQLIFDHSSPLCGLDVLPTLLSMRMRVGGVLEYLRTCFEEVGPIIPRPPHLDTRSEVNTKTEVQL